MSWYLAALRRYAEFGGRSRRKEYWFFALFSFIVTLVLMAVDAAIAGQVGGIGLLSSIYSLAVMVPSLAVFVRRLHDSGRSGWWFFFGLVPLVGGIVLLIFMFMDSEPGTNKYGPNPKAYGGAVLA